MFLLNKPVANRFRETLVLKVRKCLEESERVICNEFFPSREFPHAVGLLLDLSKLYMFHVSGMCSVPPPLSSIEPRL